MTPTIFDSDFDSDFDSGPELRPAALRATGLRFAYSGRAEVLTGVNVVIRERERVGLVGPNGAGKTTFFLLAGGVLKPTAGDICLFEQPVVCGRFNPSVNLVFQKADDQLFCPSVWEDVAFGPRNMGLSQDEVTARVTQALVQTGTDALASRPVHHLSGGEKRLVAIAGVLAMRPRLVIYDEPSAGLDMRSRRRLISLLLRTQETILLASHDLELILEVCDRVILMDQGAIVADGDAEIILGDAALMEAHGQEKPHSLIPHQVKHHH